MERYVIIGISGNECQTEVMAWDYNHAVKLALKKTGGPALIHKYGRISDVVYINV